AGFAGTDDLDFDAAGSLYVADVANNRIRKVDTNGIITTVAGNGYGYTYVHGTAAGDGGPATNSILSFPCGVAFDDAGNLYIADNSHNRIRRVDTNGIITTVAGNGGSTYSGDGGSATNASLYLPGEAVFDSVGNIYI